MGDANAAQASTHATAYSKTIHNCLSNESLTYAPYVSLASSEVSSLLDELAHPYTIPLHSDVRKGLKADGVNFQPCKASRTMDRYVVEQIEVSGRVWTLTGVFDGMCIGMRFSKYGRRLKSTQATSVKRPSNTSCITSRSSSDTTFPSLAHAHREHS